MKVGPHMDALVLSVNEAQAYELIELGFPCIDADFSTLADIETLAEQLPQDQAVVVRADSGDLSRMVTMALSEAGIDAVDAGTLALSKAPRLVA